MASNYTPEMLAILDAAIAQGVTSVYYADKRVEYRSLNEMLRIRDLMKSELGVKTNVNARRLATFNSGL